MNNKFIVNYVPGKTFFEQLNGFTKLILFLSNLLLIMFSFDIRILTFVFFYNLLFLLLIHPSWEKIKGIVYFITITNLINILLMYLVAPDIGPNNIGSSHVLFQFIGRYDLSLETLFYLGVRFLKIFCMFVTSLWFILSITPSQLAAGLHRMKVPYKICTVISLGLRSIPDILSDYQDINHSMQMRGIELDKNKTSLFKRLKYAMTIVIPLILSSFAKVNKISSAMELRRFGIFKDKTYYIDNKLNNIDRLFICLGLVQLFITIIYVFFY